MMRRYRYFPCVFAAGTVAWTASALAAITIDPAHPYAYGANAG